MTAMPCLSVSDTVLWIFSQTFQLPVQKCRWCLCQKATWASSHVLGTQYLINQSKILIPPFDNASLFVVNVYRMVHAFTCAGVLHLSVPKWHGVLDWGASVMLMLDEVWMTIYSSTFLFSHICHCLFTLYQQMGADSCQQGCWSFNAGFFWRGESPSTFLPPRGGKYTYMKHNKLLLYTFSI